LSRVVEGAPGRALSSLLPGRALSSLLPLVSCGPSQVMMDLFEAEVLKLQLRGKGSGRPGAGGCGGSASGGGTGLTATGGSSGAGGAGGGAGDPAMETGAMARAALSSLSQCTLPAAEGACATSRSRPYAPVAWAGGGFGAGAGSGAGDGAGLEGACLPPPGSGFLIASSNRPVALSRASLKRARALMQDADKGLDRSGLAVELAGGEEDCPPVVEGRQVKGRSGLPPQSLGAAHPASSAAPSQAGSISSGSRGRGGADGGAGAANAGLGSAAPHPGPVSGAPAPPVPAPAPVTSVPLPPPATLPAPATVPATAAAPDPLVPCVSKGCSGSGSLVRVDTVARCAAADPTEDSPVAPGNPAGGGGASTGSGLLEAPGVVDACPAPPQSQSPSPSPLHQTWLRMWSRGAADAMSPSDTRFVRCLVALDTGVSSDDALGCHRELVVWERAPEAAGVASGATCAACGRVVTAVVTAAKREELSQVLLGSEEGPRQDGAATAVAAGAGAGTPSASSSSCQCPFPARARAVSLRAEWAYTGTSIGDIVHLVHCNDSGE
jgi:hypothetical protein